jgi:preprotein translocase subunit SecF/SecD/SecF fusion protein
MLLKYWPAKTNVSFMKLRLPAAIASFVLLLASVATLATQGLNLGVDFAGGSVIEVAASETVTVQAVRDELAPLGLNETVTDATGTGTDSETVIIIKFGSVDPAMIAAELEGVPEHKQEERAQQEANDLVRAELQESFPDIVIRSSEAVGPKVSGELFRAGITALGVSLILMMIYIWFRFEWQFSIGSVAALGHDVLLTMGMFSFLQLEFNLTTIAALLTIIGYSMNDTVVVFDRVREEKRKYKKMPDRQVVDLALNGTLSRTLLTSGTTLLALLAIFFLGGPVLQGMSFALIWGVIIGTYSSVFIASSIVLLLGMDLNKKPAEDVSGFQGVGG